MTNENLTFFFWFVFLICVLYCQKMKQNKQKKRGCLMSVQDVQFLFWSVFTHPALFKRNWGIIATDARKLIAEEFFENSLDTYVACFPLANTPRLSALLCVPKHAVRSACEGLNSASLLLDYWHINIYIQYMENLHPNYVVLKKKWF